MTILHFCLNTAHHSKHTVTNGDDLSCSSSSVVVSDAKRVLVGAGARALFYPTLLYNVIRNKIQSEFRWWDRIDELILLGAVPFPADVPRLRELGVSGVVTLNELHETLVPTSLYHVRHVTFIAVGEQLKLKFMSDCCNLNLTIYLGSLPILESLSESHCKTLWYTENASLGKTTYVHCKASRRCSTTIVLCYLFDYMIVEKYLALPAKQDEETFDNDSSNCNLDGYEASCDSGNEMLADLSLACKVWFASQAAVARLSSLWLQCLADQKTTRKKLETSVNTDESGSIGVDIRTGYIFQCEEKSKQRLLLFALVSSGLFPTLSSYAKTKRLMYRDFEVGQGDCPKDGQQVFLSLALETTSSFS
ncbi:hypothetical protein Q3G72_018959 [Acer saccharum]|nr:hypothetical protein Q3G72_018959 [Acer saccharum]